MLVAAVLVDVAPLQKPLQLECGCLEAPEVTIFYNNVFVIEDSLVSHGADGVASWGGCHSSKWVFSGVRGEGIVVTT
jgi:hypothetical protein